MTRRLHRAFEGDCAGEGSWNLILICFKLNLPLEAFYYFFSPIIWSYHLLGTYFVPATHMLVNFSQPHQYIRITWETFKLYQPGTDWNHISKGEAWVPNVFIIFKRFYLFIFRERGREGEWGGEKHQCETGTSTGCLLQLHQPGTWPATQARALTRNQRPFGLQDDAQPIEPYQSGQVPISFKSPLNDSNTQPGLYLLAHNVILCMLTSFFSF